MSGSRITQYRSKKSTEKLEILLGLDINPADLHENAKYKLLNKQQKWSGILAERYQKSFKAPHDPEKAKNYYKKTLDLSKITDTALKFHLPTHNASLISTSVPRASHSWYNAIRLLIVRTRRLGSLFAGLNIKALGLPFSKSLNAIQSFLKPITESPLFKRILGIAGVIYLANFAFDIGIIIKSTFFEPKKAHENRLGPAEYWQRFKNVLFKGDRPSRMLNDAIWGTINLVGFLLVGPAAILINAIINLAGFGFDIINESAKGIYSLKSHHAIKSYYDNKESSEHTELIKHGLDKQIKAIWKERIYKIICCTLILTAMALIYFPPVPIVALIGAGIALVAGSFAAGFGQKLWHLAKEKYNHYFNKSKAQTGMDIPEPDNKKIPDHTLAKNFTTPQSKPAAFSPRKAPKTSAYCCLFTSGKSEMQHRSPDTSLSWSPKKSGQ